MASAWWPCLIVALLSSSVAFGFPRSPSRPLEVSLSSLHNLGPSRGRGPSLGGPLHAGGGGRGRGHELQGTGLGFGRTGLQTYPLILGKALSSPWASVSPPVKWVIHHELLTSLSSCEGPPLRKGQRGLGRAGLSPVVFSGAGCCARRPHGPGCRDRQSEPRSVEQGKSPVLLPWVAQDLLSADLTFPISSEPFLL